jgi:hypothetical protein
MALTRPEILDHRMFIITSSHFLSVSSLPDPLTIQVKGQGLPQRYLTTSTPSLLTNQLYFTGLCLQMSQHAAAISNDQGAFS